MISDQSAGYLQCIEANCAERYSINERLYTCPACGGLLDVQYQFDQSNNAEQLKAMFKERRLADTGLDRSGVWRFRELLPFVEDLSRVITLAEGNTPIYDAPRSASYAGLDAIAIQASGNESNRLVQGQRDDHRRDASCAVGCVVLSRAHRPATRRLRWRLMQREPE